MTRHKRSKPIRMWGGFEHGQLSYSVFDNVWGTFPALFKTRAKATIYFEDVRRVEIREIAKNAEGLTP